MKADSHDSIGHVKCLLHTIAVMHVDVDVKHPLMVLEQLQNRKHNIVDVAEATCFLLLCMVKATSPIDADVRTLVVEFNRRIDGATA